MCMLVLLSTASLTAQDRDALEYDIFSRDSTMVVWANIAPCLTEGDIEQLRDGLDVVLHCRLRLTSPRTILPDRKIANRADILRLGFRPVTEDYFLQRGDSASTHQHSFVSLSGLLGYLRDSVEIRLVKLDSLDQSKQFAIELVVTSIILSDLNLARKEADQSESGGSPVQFLFRQFLSITGYGSREYRSKSRSFSPDEIRPHP